MEKELAYTLDNYGRILYFRMSKELFQPSCSDGTMTQVSIVVKNITKICFYHILYQSVH